MRGLSDAERKTGCSVPGMGSEVLTCTDWGARDIEREVRQDCGLDAPLFLYPDGGLGEPKEPTSLQTPEATWPRRLPWPDLRSERLQ
ncbi:MAG: hypothetical protein P8N31_06660 [Planctomycetota bacterium]|nr:hypothetical protein [Planctomycetota bacterium]MDG2143217.1 hypothetical protein [Planctomycetota bacterium]